MYEKKYTTKFSFNIDDKTKSMLLELADVKNLNYSDVIRSLVAREFHNVVIMKKEIV